MAALTFPTLRSPIPLAPILRAPLVAFRAIRDSVGPEARAIWTGDGRVHVSVRGPAVSDDAEEDEQRETFAADLAERIAEVPGIAWAGLDRGCGRLVVACAEGVPAEEVVEPVVAAVEEVEQAHGAQGKFPALIDQHPADEVSLARHTLEAAADVAAVAASVTGRIVGRATSVPRRLLPIDPVPLIGLVANQQLLRKPLERVLGQAGADTALGVATAFASGFEQQFTAPAVDLVHRVLLVRQEQSRTSTFARVEPELYPQAPAEPPVELPPHGRPVPVPPGPVERYAEQDLVATVAAALAMLPMSNRVQEATRVLGIGVPKAARLGREAFAAGVVEYLGRCGVLVTRPEPVRLLDQIDQVLVDPQIVGDLDERVLKAAERAGIEIIVLRPEVGRPGRVRITPGRPVGSAAGEVASAVAWMQRDGHVVALIAGPGEPALASADIGVALAQPPAAVPWHADLIAPDGPSALAALVGAAELARTVSRHSVLLALGGSAVSAFTTYGLPYLGRTGTTGRPRALLPPTAGVDAAAVAAIVHGRLSADRLRPPPGSSTPHDHWHGLPVAEVLEQLGSRTEGLEAGEAARRKPIPAPEPSALGRLATHIIEELRNPLTPVLAVGAGLSLAVGSVLDAGMVAAVVLADAAIGAVQRYRAEGAIKALEQASTQIVRVRRPVEQGTGQRVVQIPASELVVGDVVLFDTGEGVPADCRIVKATALETDESALTGESLPVHKSARPTDAEALADQTSMLFAGTAIAAGRATAVVVATGADTAAGRAAAGVKAPVTGVEKRLEKLASRATPVALIAGGLTVAASLARGRPLAETLATGVSLTVAAVPEGLPILATAAQLAGGKRLARRGVLVRHMRAVEALGRVDLLCVDKTGTLTEGVLHLHSVHDGSSSAVLGPAGWTLSPGQREVLETALVVSAATPADRRRPGSTDAAVVEAAEQAGLDAPARPTAELAYESGRGFHAVAIGAELAVVGAPETVLDRCTRTADGPIDQDARARLDDLLDRLAGDGGRVLAVGHRTLDRAPARLSDDISGFEFTGFLVLADPARPDAREAIERLEAAGVRPVLITGDHPATARWIAAELGILNGHGTALSGPELDRLDDDALDALLPDLAVCARVTPAHKARLVAGFRRIGHVVAMTGDGVNDAAAIRHADVGIALGGNSTAAARKAADVVLVNASIEGIVDAVIEGRALWLAVRDAVANLVGHNYGEIAVITGASLLTGTTPLTARQLLLVNLFTDTVPALAIAMRPPPQVDPAQLLAEGPDRSFGPALSDAIAVRGIATGVAGGAGYFTGRVTGTISRARTITLLSIVGAQLGQTCLARPNDPVVVGSSLAAYAVLLGIVETPVLSRLFGCTPLGPAGLLIAGVSAAAGTALVPVLPKLLEVVRRGRGVPVSVQPTRELTARKREEAGEEQLGTVRELHGRS